MKRSFEFNLDSCIGDYTKRPATVAPMAPVAVPKLELPPPPAPPPAPAPAPVLEAAPEAQSAAQKMLHELINGPPLLTPLAALQPQPQPHTQPPPVFAPEAPPDAPLDPHRHRHAGILREFGGVREWMKAAYGDATAS